MVKETETWRSEADGFPQDAVPVAEDQEGNAIVLLPGDDRFYVWDHELWEMESIELIFDEWRRPRAQVPLTAVGTCRARKSSCSETLRSKASPT